MARLIQYLASVLVMTILCGVSGTVDTKTDLHRFCMGLENELSSNNNAANNADAAFREAQKFMKSLVSFGPIPRLAKAWRAVIKGEPCGKQSADYVTTIAACNPNNKGGLATLYAAVKLYTNKCLTATFWDKQLKKTVGSSGDKSGLTKFMDARFLENYRKDNADEPALHFSTIGGQNCCQADMSHGALLVALVPILGANTRETLRNDPKQAQSALQKHLFNPCERYLKTMDELMWQANRASNYYTPNQQAFVDGLSQEFQDAIFRYKYCSNFRYLSTQDKLEEIDFRRF